MADVGVGFLASVGGQDAGGGGGWLGGLLGPAHTGGAPSPFDGMDGGRLAGPSGSHPLASLTAGDLLRARTDGLEGGIELTGQVRVGEAITGTIRVRATKPLEARAAGLRLVGVLIAEEQRSQTRSTGGSGGQTSTTTESWVEVHGHVIDDLTFTEPSLPAAVEAGQVLEIPFTIPAPQLGPPSAHAGSALVAWALEAHWDIHMGSDE